MIKHVNFSHLQCEIAKYTNKVKDDEKHFREKSTIGLFVYTLLTVYFDYAFCLLC